MITTATPPSTDVLTAEQVGQYQREGCVLLPQIIPNEHLQLLRSSCQASMDATDAEMDAKGTDVLGISRRGNRYFSTNPSHTDQRLNDFIFSPLMESVCRQLLGNTVHVFWEQYVVKGPETGMSFSWHQDSGYVSADTPHKPYLTCWCALDDMSEANGTAYILPQSRAGIRSRVEHIQDPQINDLVGYFGNDPGDPVLCPAGSMALFSSVTFHRSGWNRTPRLRRVYLIQYSHEVIRRRDGTPWGRSESFLVNGERITAVT
ncbi:MAG: phytanoyl-CoA dioxygenase family protein [Planctomycetota bacterium]